MGRDDQVLYIGITFHISVCCSYFSVKDFSVNLDEDVRIRFLSASRGMRNFQRGGFSYVTCGTPKRQPGGFCCCQVVNFREKKRENVSKPE